MINIKTNKVDLILLDINSTDKVPTDYIEFSNVDQLDEILAKELVETIIVEECPSPYNDMGGGYHYAFVDYELPGEYAGWQGDAGCYPDAIQSFCSLIRSVTKNNNMDYKIYIKTEKIFIN